VISVGRGKAALPQGVAQPHTMKPGTITGDKNPAYPNGIAAMKEDGDLWRRPRLRQVRLLNNIVEQDYRRMKRRIHPGLGLRGFRTARGPLAGFEVIAKVRKDQVRSENAMGVQHTFITGLFQIVA
jgi:transposase, IS6 family